MFMSLSTMAQWHCILPNSKCTNLDGESRVVLKRKDRNNEYNQTSYYRGICDVKNRSHQRPMATVKVHGMSLDYFKSSLNEVTVKLSVLTVKKTHVLKKVCLCFLYLYPLPWLYCQEHGIGASLIL